MQMYIKCLIIYIIFCLFRLGTFRAETIKIAVNENGSEIQVTVNEDHDVGSAFFCTEINHECSTDCNFIQKPNNSETFACKIGYNKVIKNNDIVRIHSVFEARDEVTTQTFDFKINEHGNGVKQDIPKNIEQESSGCLKSDTEQNFKSQPCSGTLIFKEDFDNLLNWSHEVRSRVMATAPDQEFVAYVNSTENSYIKNSTLYLSANWVNNTTFRLNNCTSKYPKNRREYRQECGPIGQRGGVTVPAVYSAKLHTLNKFQFKYGRVEIRARMPIGDWLFPYIILQPVNTKSEDSYANHIRIAYSRGNEILQNKNSVPINGQMLFGSAVLWSSEGPTEYMNIKPNLPKILYGTDFHIYTLIWHKDRIIFKVDGFTYGTIKNIDVLQAFSSNECFIALGLTAGGGLNFPDDYVHSKQKPFSNADIKAADIFREKTNNHTWIQPNLLIDYVHVYTTHASED